MSYLKTKFASIAYGTFSCIDKILNSKSQYYDVDVTELNISSYTKKLDTEYIYNVVVN